jgi:hypothetical protein
MDKSCQYFFTTSPVCDIAFSPNSSKQVSGERNAEILLCMRQPAFLDAAHCLPNIV